VRIAIVNDVVMAVEAMRQVLARAPQHQLAWIARDGAQAVEQAAHDTPDLILMDLIMPQMDGVEATQRIMAQSPCAIVVVTASVGTNSSKVFEAMGAGALDAVNTPILAGVGTPDGAASLLDKIEIIRKLLGADASRKPKPPSAARLKHARVGRSQLVAIGASAGGPAALAKVLSPLPPDFPAATVIVQHVDARFAPGLAAWLAQQTRLPVRVAVEGDRPVPATVLLAGAENHLAFGGSGSLGYGRQPVNCSYRPSVDVFFRSVTRFWRGDVIGVVLTGMGRDGAEGLKLLRQAGHCTIAQDKASCAVYGMPKAAAELDAASEILPLGRIGPRLVELVNQKAKRAIGYV
jgi:chemotaxis response regulator CheB